MFLWQRKSPVITRHSYQDLFWAHHEVIWLIYEDSPFANTRPAWLDLDLLPHTNLTFVSLQLFFMQHKPKWKCTQPYSINWPLRALTNAHPENTRRQISTLEKWVVWIDAFQNTWMHRKRSERFFRSQTKSRQLSSNRCSRCKLPWEDNKSVPFGMRFFFLRIRQTSYLSDHSFSDWKSVSLYPCKFNQMYCS